MSSYRICTIYRSLVLPACTKKIFKSDLNQKIRFKSKNLILKYFFKITIFSNLVSMLHGSVTASRGKQLCRITKRTQDAGRK